MKYYHTSFWLVSLMLSTLLLCSACAPNQKPTGTGDVRLQHNQFSIESANEKLNARFLVNAAERLALGLELGQIAQRNGQSKEVIALGKLMEEDHTRSLNKLTLLSAQKLITVPLTPTNKAQNAIKKLNDKTDEQFDMAYCVLLISTHKQAIGLFEKVSTESSDADIKAWAKTTLPIIQEHLQHAIACQEMYEKL